MSPGYRYNFQTQKRSHVRAVIPISMSLWQLFSRGQSLLNWRQAEPKTSPLKADSSSLLHAVEPEKYKEREQRTLSPENCAVGRFTIVPASVLSQPAWLRVISLMSYCIFSLFL